jgi:hypothetical protein
MLEHQFIQDAKLGRESGPEQQGCYRSLHRRQFVAQAARPGQQSVGFLVADNTLGGRVSA